MAVEKNMTVILDARIEGLTRQMEAANKQLGNFGRRVDKAMSDVDRRFNGLSKIKNFALGTVTLDTAVAAIERAVTSTAKLADAAKTAGVSAAFLQEFQYGLVLNGGAAEEAGDAIATFSVRLAEAQAGSGELKDILDQLHIPVKDLDGSFRSVEDVLLDVAEATRNANSAQEANLITTKAFGKGNKELVQFLSEGKEGIKQYAAEAQKLGVVLSDETIAKAKEFDDAWNKALFAGGAYFKRFSITAIQAIKDIFTAQSGGIAILPGGMMMSHGMAIAGQGYSGAGTTADTDWSDVLNDEDVDYFGSDASAPKKGPKLDLSGSREKAASAAAKQADAIKNVIDALQFESEQLQRNETEQHVYAELRKANVTATSEEGLRIRALVEANDALTESQKRQEEQAKRNKEAVRELGLTFSSAFEDAIANGSELSDVLQGLYQDLTKLVTRKLVTEPAMGFLDDFFDGLDFGSMFGGGDAFGQSFFDDMDFADFVDFGFANGGIMTSRGAMPLRKYAGGGIASSPQIAMFGEGKTPEAFVPLPDGRSIPVTMSGAAGGGVAVHQTFNIDQRGADDGFLKRWPAMKAELIRDSVAAVAAEASRGGEFSKQVGRRAG